ncbi:MAG: DUF1638 domain-containing protein [Actinobacteria bacterium]|nr:DUF1638 domain-containing protein [Actinomycetota bacterium]
MKNIAIICDVMKSDFMEIAEKKSLNNMDFIFMEQQLHNTPDLMRKKLQEEIDKIDSGREYGRIILGYGLCSNGVMNLVSKNHEIVIPKVDDCISLFLGSKERYIEEFRKDPATYYLCKGWIEFGGDPYRGYLLWTGRENKIPHEWLRGRKRYGLKKYDETMARFLVTEMLKNYKRILLINNNDLNEQHRKFVSDMIIFLNEVLEREITLEEVEGSLKFIEKLIRCDFDEKNFLNIKPGEKIKQEDFFK